MITLASIKDQVSKIIQTCPDDARVAEYVNRAERRLIYTGKWVGAVARLKICTNDACLTWPRQIQTIEAYAVNTTPGVIRNEWFEFIGNGPGQIGETDYRGDTLIDRGLACTFDDVRYNGTTPPRLKLYADDASDAGKRVLLKFYDSNGNKVYTNDPIAGWIEGVFVTLVAPPAYATASDPVGGTAFTCLAGGLYEVQKPATNRVIRLYSYDPVLATQTPLGYYEPSETLPRYRRSLIPYLASFTSCATLPCSSKYVTVLAKLQHVDVSLDTDSLVLECEEAILKECEAIKFTDPPPGDEAAAAAAHAKAVMLLQEQLNSHIGDGAVIAVRAEDSEIWGGGGVTAFNWS